MSDREQQRYPVMDTQDWGIVVEHLFGPNEYYMQSHDSTVSNA